MNQAKIPVDLILKNIEENRQSTHKKLRKASAVLTSELDTAISSTPYDVVYEEDRVKLKHYKPEKVKVKTPLLIIYALINRETMLDLQPRRSVVESLLGLGVEIYMVDWGYPTRKDQFLTIGDHVNGFIDNIVDFICKKNGIAQINIMGICMGGVFSIIYTALHPHRVKNLVTTVTPSNFDTDKGLLNVWMKQTDAQILGDVYANMPGDIMNLGFLLLNPARLMIDKYVGFMQNIDDKSFVENFIRMEKWIFDSPDVPAATFRQFIEDLYKKNLLIDSKLVIDGERVDLQKITMPLLNFYGKFDHLVPPEACNLLTARVGSSDKEDICFDTGHIGIYVSSKCQREFAPKIADWLLARDE
ncbi:MAG: hypothetical protein ACD_75C00719G0002 [uncultured bacterium]|nr:MAG: hypothetical protein ACD_75C00719G0002 [uncultured bacterium]